MSINDVSETLLPRSDIANRQRLVLDPISPEPFSSIFSPTREEPRFTDFALLEESDSKPQVQPPTMATAIVPVLIGLVSEVAQNLIKTETESLEKQYPGLTPFQIFEKVLGNLLSKFKLSDAANKKIHDELQNLHLATIVAKISKFATAAIPLIKEAFNSPLATNIREFAQHFDTASIQNVVGNDLKHLAEQVRTESFKMQPTATIQGMLENQKLALTKVEASAKADTIGVLSQLKDNFMTAHPISAMAAVHPEALSNVAPENVPVVTGLLKKLSRTVAISPTTKVVEHLSNNGLTSALAVAQIPKANFVNSAVEGSAGAISPSTAALTHDLATTTVRRNENMAMALVRAGRGTGLKAIDGDGFDRKLQLQAQIKQQGLDLNIENLFGSMDQCVCDDCTTVYSASSYFVDLLIYLRNSNLSLVPNANTSTAGQPDDISNTVLEKLFRRRPDLGNLELTCENTNTILPYIDLANEIMESFIVNLDSYDTIVQSDSSASPQATIDAFNVSDFQDSAELLSQPQNINFDAYRTLSTSVYPFTLPYHLPISTSRVFLQYLGVARGDLLDAARHKPPVVNQIKTNLQDLQKTALDRQVDAEYLGLVQEEYIILTREAFFTDAWFNVTEKITPGISGEDYRNRIGVRDIWSYWGYADLKSMLDTGDASTGLCFVKDQLLPRSGLSWVELTQLIQTNFLNPMYPTGRNKTVFDELKFSYRFLQTLVDTRQTDNHRRLRKLAEFLVSTELINMAELLWTESHNTSSQLSIAASNSKSRMTNSTSGNGKKGTKNSKGHGCVDADEIRHWVFHNFENMGKLVVLEFGEGPFLSDGKSPNPEMLSGRIFATTKEGQQAPQPPIALPKFPDNAIGILDSDGSIKGPDGGLLATVTIASTVVMGDAVSGGKTLNDTFPKYSFEVLPTSSTSIAADPTVEIPPGQTTIAWIQDGVLKVPGEGASGNPVLNLVQWVLSENQGSGCNIDNVRLQHLNGTPLENDVWDRLHRFIRLWRKLGWSIGEMDRAVTSLSNPNLCDPVTSSPPANGTTSALSNGATTNGVTNGVNGRDSDTDPDDFLITFDDYTNSNSGSSKPNGGNGSNGGVTKPSWTPTITPCLIEQLPALVRTIPLVSIPLEQLLCFWTDIPTTAVASDTSTTGTKSLYEKLFFTSNLKMNDPIFGPDANGDYFTGSEQKISDNLPVIMAAFRLKANDILFLLGQIPDPFTTKNPPQIPDTANASNSSVPSMIPNPLLIPDILNISNLSMIYRTALLARILGLNVYDVYRAIEGFGKAFNSATVFFDFLTWWDIMESLNFSWDNLRYIVDEIYTPHSPLIPTADSVLGTAKTLNDGIEAIKTKYVAPTNLDNANIECTDEIVQATLALVFDSTKTGNIMGILDGTTIYTAIAAPDVPEIPDPSTKGGLTFAMKVAAIGTGKLTYSNPPGGVPQLRCKGILTADELELAKELVDDINAALAAQLAANGTVAKTAKAKKDLLTQTETNLDAAWNAALES
jgi:hypothetical protein